MPETKQIIVSSSSSVVWPETNIEAHSTIIERLSPELYSVDALTDAGWLRLLGLGVDEAQRNELALKLHLCFQGDRTKITPASTKSTSFIRLSYSGEDAAESEDAWTQSPDRVLEKLQAPNTSQADLSLAIIVAEVTDFQTEQLIHVLDIMGSFIADNRLSKNTDTVTSVCSAIRKFSMNMCEADFPKYAGWFEPSATEYLDSHIELALLKGICSRLSFVPTEIPIVSQELIDAVESVRAQYNNPHLLLRENFAAVLIEATVARIFLESLAEKNDVAIDVWNAGVSMKPTWVSEMIEDQVSELLEFMEENSPELATTVQSIVDA